MFSAYANFDLHLFDFEVLEGSPALRVQVEWSPAGLQDKPERVAWPPGLDGRLNAVENGINRMAPGDVEAMGRDLATLLLPPQVRDYYVRSLQRLGDKTGLRIRIRCSDEALDVLPWELTYLDLAGTVEKGAGDARGFLALDRRISIVRRESGPRADPQAPRSNARRRMLAVMCEPQSLRGSQGLDLAGERENLRQALGGDASKFDLIDCIPPTRERLQELLFDDTDVFHFAGHGRFERWGAAMRAVMYLQRGEGDADPLAVDDLTSQLAGRGIQLAMLGACCSARSDGSSVGVAFAPSLVRAGIPAVIGMQHPIEDVSARAFSYTLYRAWLHPMSLDEAVSEARRAVRNLPGGGFEFGTAVLYLSDSGLPQAEPIVVPARATQPPHGPAPADVERVLGQLLKLYDYKCVHDALHDALMRDFDLLQQQIESFPHAKAIDGCKKHAEQLKRRLGTVCRVKDDGRCDPQLLDDIIGDFTEANRMLKQAIDTQDVDLLHDVESTFEWFLTTQLPRVDIAMKTLAGHLGLDVLIAFLATLPVVDRDWAMQQKADLQALHDKLQRGASLHSRCQSIDSKLALIRRAGNGWKKELSIHYKRLVTMLENVSAEWNPDEQNGVLEAKAELDEHMANVDEDLAKGAFDKLCRAFDHAFWRIDIDYKDLCGGVRQPTHPVQQLYMPRNLQ